MTKHGVNPVDINEYEFTKPWCSGILINPFPLLSDGIDGIVVRPFDAPITYETSFVLPSGVPPSQLARQFMNFVKLTTPQQKYSEPI